MLKEKGINPHLLTMTATPIPRTVALTLYGELDLSTIDEMPKGRQPVATFAVPKEKRESGYRWIKEQIKKHHGQVFIICPLIEESPIETLKSVKAAKKEFEKLSKEIFPEFRLGLLHGKIKSKEKDKIMNDFKSHKHDILVATPVVEVGIDIANATIMVIEAAERFGLAQLHQLRGRVGRGQKQSYCFLFTEREGQQIAKRLTFFAKTQNGVSLAEYDLKNRGPGEIYGTKQHGVVNLKIARLSDYQLIEKTKKAVAYFIQKYSVDKFPGLKKRVEEYKIKEITRD
jgi:ATP-dependent DNA helicase RecG